MVDTLRKEIGKSINFQIPEGDGSYEVVQNTKQPCYTRYLIRYPSSENDLIWAYLLIPDGEGPFPAVMVHHQNADKENLGKSEVCGITGESLQSFGHVLANRGIAVLAPDSICYEDRRRHASGVIPDSNDWVEHYNEMCYRLLVGDSLIKKILIDAAKGLTILEKHPAVNPGKIGVLGHAYGGKTTLFQAALDERIQFACSSGAACTYKNKMIKRTKMGMAEIIPGFLKHYDVYNLVQCIAPRRLLLVSFAEDPNSFDAPYIVEKAQSAFNKMDVPAHLEHRRFPKTGCSREWFKYITEWIVSCGGMTNS